MSKQLWLWFNEGNSEGGTEDSETAARKAAEDNYLNAGYSDYVGCVFVGPVTATGKPQQCMKWTDK
jgi:hypothetical protein